MARISIHALPRTVAFQILAAVSEGARIAVENGETASEANESAHFDAGRAENPKLENATYVGEGDRERNIRAEA